MAADDGSADSCPPPAWPRPRPGVEKQLYEEEEEEGMRKKQRVVEAEKKVDHMGGLPDEVVMVIVNKLFNMKTLIRFSLVAKRYYSLVSHTHSLVVEVPVGSTSSTPNAIDQIFSAITHHRFQQIKHLHLHLRSSNPSSSSPAVKPQPPLGMGNTNGIFAIMVTVFGSHLEKFHLLSAASVNPNPNPNTNNALASASASNVALVAGLNAPLEAGLDPLLEGSLEMMKVFLSFAGEMHDIIRGLVSECKMIETAVFSDYLGRAALVMGKQQIAKLKQNMAASSSSSSSSLASDNHPPQLRLLRYLLPTLDLPKTGYTLNDVTFVAALSGDHDAEEPVEVMGSCEAEEMVNGSHLDDFDFEKLDVYTEATRLIFNHHVNKVTVYDLLRPYEHLLPTKG